jgi:hypothetical protein
MRSTAQGRSCTAAIFAGIGLRASAHLTFEPGLTLGFDDALM